MRVLNGHASEPLDALQRQLDEWVKQIAEPPDPLVGSEAYDVLSDWLDDEIILPDERVGYEEDWPHPVVATLHDDGTLTLEAPTP